MTEAIGHPAQIEQDIRAVRRLEWWNIAWSVSIVTVMGLAMGSSQAMKTAWVEDTLGLVPPIVILIATSYEARSADARFHYGYDRVNSLGFLVAAVALGGVGLFLLRDSVVALWEQEHVTVGSVRMLGHDIWLGWFMLAAQAYATIPPLIIGRRELPLAERLRDKLVHTDALMNKANWQTGVAGLLGVGGLGFGLWWADPIAAIAISGSIVWDAWNALKIATAELVDGIPRELGNSKLSPEAQALARALEEQFPLAEKVLLRETGRYIRAEVVGVRPPEDFALDNLDVAGCDRWRIDSVSFRPTANRTAPSE
ncbi:cation transporter [Novosphingobium sp. JCM 18896]|uniref:cation transporter n=1 Tax=Novosphingobium sp. JCM 18896 TaxID=2989731 RepID=UPI0022233DA1|nr:cation transporter [Novosphingobium sp. JCM 18896]MCW1432168.1 cation transporter [Novosphingobium sp. JCM 18896]